MQRDKRRVKMKNRGELVNWSVNYCCCDQIHITSFLTMMQQTAYRLLVGAHPLGIQSWTGVDKSKSKHARNYIYDSTYLTNAYITNGHTTRETNSRK